jgi:hypothetical protein
MPGVGFQKLSNCLLGGKDSLYPTEPYIYVSNRHFNSLKISVQGDYVSGSPYALATRRPGYVHPYCRTMIYRSSNNSTFTLLASGDTNGLSANLIKGHDTGLTTGTSYYYYGVYEYTAAGGFVYRTQGPTMEVKTRASIQATGGNYTMIWKNRHGAWKMHVYRDSANFVTTTVPRGEKVWCFVLGGGGSGGKSRGGGGGGGGIQFIPIFSRTGAYGEQDANTDYEFYQDFFGFTSVSTDNSIGINVAENTTYSITVGAGGGEVNGGGSAQGNDGGNSVAFGLTGRGGGGGGAYANVGRSGGNGGGGGAGGSAYRVPGTTVSGFLTSGYYFGYNNNVWGSYSTLSSYVTQYSGQGYGGYSGFTNDLDGGGGGGPFSSASNAVSDGKQGQIVNSSNYNYQFVGTGLSGTTTRIASGGGGGGYSYGYGGGNVDNGAGDGSNAWGQDYYAYPAGLGGAATWFGCGGGGGGKGGGGGGAGYKGLVIVAYCTGNPVATDVGY